MTDVLISLLSSLASLFGTALGLLAYFGVAYGLFCMSRTCGLPRPWLAFIPYTRTYQLGALADHIGDRTTGKRSKLRIWLLALEISMGALIMLAVVFFIICYTVGIINKNPDFMATMGGTAEWVLLILAIVSFALALVSVIVYMVFFYVALHRIYRAFAPRQAALFTVVSILFFPPIALFLFLIAKRRPTFMVAADEASDMASL